MKIVFATDHAGFELKEALVVFVRDELGYDIEDCGAYTLDENDDYPDVVAKAARLVQAQPDETRGIILGGTGQGEAMVANRFTEVRAAVYYGGNTDILALSRQHNNANVLSLGARFLSLEEAQDAVRAWLVTPFSGDERHVRRITNIDTQQ